VAQRKGEKLQLRPEVDLRLDFIATNEAEFVPLGPELRVPAFIPASFVGATTLRIQAYRHIAETTARGELERLGRDWRDRFGPFPTAVDNLFLLTEIKLAAAEANISRVEVRERKLMLTRRGDFILVGGKFPRLVAGKIEQLLGEIVELLKKL
jgi:transcription-repair coupling factor (superfamily II helicase)